jgi:transcriptional regulator with XRE-family HTH domain
MVFQMDTVGSRLKLLRASTNLSQKAIGEKIGTKQSAINRYENDQSELSYKMLLLYADFFDVSLDYIFCRTNDPQGRLYGNDSPYLKRKMADKEEWQQFVEACFDPSSPMFARLKESMLTMMEGGQR